MMLVLLAAGTGSLSSAVPLTLVTTGMLVLLLVLYTQVIAAHPEGGGAYAVAKLNLGRGSRAARGGLPGGRLRANRRR